MKSEYARRLNRVIDYINHNLGEDLSLDHLAEIANFSKFHFHRIFSAETGESLGAYIQRLRLEKSAGLLVALIENPITEIAHICGFSSSAVFSRAFRECFGMTPRDWRAGRHEEHSKNCKIQSNRYPTISKYREASKVLPVYGKGTPLHWRINMKRSTGDLEYQVVVNELSAKNVAYVRHTGPYAGDAELFGSLFGRLMKWAGPRDLFVPGETEFLTIYHDSPDVTEEEKLRISVCMTVPEGTEASGEVGTMVVPGGKYAVAEFRIGIEEYGDAWNSLCGVWLPESGYQFADGPVFELYLNDPEQDPEHKHHIAIHLPVQPL